MTINKIITAFLLAVAIGGTSLAQNSNAKSYYDIISNTKGGLDQRNNALHRLCDGFSVQPRSEAHYWLAMCYLNGYAERDGDIRSGVTSERHKEQLNEQAYQGAKNHLLIAADDGFVPAIRQLSIMYYEGKYVTRDMDDAVGYLNKLVSLGDKEALNKLQQIYKNEFASVTDERVRDQTIQLLAKEEAASKPVNNSTQLIVNSVGQPLKQSGTQKAEADPHEKNELIEIQARQHALEHELKLTQEKLQLAQSTAERNAPQVMKSPEPEHLALQTVVNPKAPQLQMAQVEQRSPEQIQPARVDTYRLPKKAEEALLRLMSIAIVVGVIASIPGTHMGLNNGLVIYNGRQDVLLSILSLVSCIVTLFLFYQSPDAAFLVSFVISGIILYFLLREAKLANGGWIKAFVAASTKLTLIGILVLSGVIAKGCLIAGFKELEKKNEKEAALNFALAILGGLAVYIFYGVIKKLIQERVSYRAT